MANPSMKSILDPQFDFHSPTLEMKKPIETSSISSSPKNNQGEQDVHSPIERVLNMEGIRSFKSFLTLKPDYYKKKDDEGEHEDSPAANLLCIMKENHTEDRPSKSSSKENDSESSDEGSTIEGSREAEAPSPNIGIAQEPENSFRPSKRHCIHESTEVTRFGPTSVSPKGTEEISELPSELNQENGLAKYFSFCSLEWTNLANLEKHNIWYLMPICEAILFWFYPRTYNQPNNEKREDFFGK